MANNYQDKLEQRIEKAEEAIDEGTMLLGSSVQPSHFLDPKGKSWVLGNVVAEAQRISRMSVKRWNAFVRENEAEAEAAIQQIVDDLGLKPHPLCGAEWTQEEKKKFEARNGCEACEGTGKINVSPDEVDGTHPCDSCQPEAFEKFRRIDAATASPIKDDGVMTPEDAMEMANQLGDELETEGMALGDPNRYDKYDMIKRESVVIAGPLKIAAYRVRDPETFEWSGLQFHMTFDNMISAMMGEEAAKLFAKFVTDITLEPVESEDFDIFINGVPTHITASTDPEISYDEIHGIVYPEDGPKYPSCTWRSADAKSSGILYPNQGLMLEQGLKISMIDTSNA